MIDKIKIILNPEMKTTLSLGIIGIRTNSRPNISAVAINDDMMIIYFNGRQSKKGEKICQQTGKRKYRMNYHEEQTIEISTRTGKENTGPDHQKS